MSCQQCSMCSYFCSDVSNLFLRLVRRHKNAASFIVHCNANGCGASFKNYSSFKSHVKRKHVYELAAVSKNYNVDDDDDDDCMEESVDEYNADLDTSKVEATFLLKLKACGGVSDAAMQEIIFSDRELYQTRFDTIKRSLPGETVRSITHLLDASTTFSELDTKHKRKRYIEQQLGAIMTKAVVMGQHIARKKYRGKSKLTTKPVCGYFVPFLDNLQSLLSMPEVQACLSNGPLGSDVLMTDVVDGCYLRNNVFFKRASQSPFVCSIQWWVWACHPHRVSHETKTNCPYFTMFSSTFRQNFAANYQSSSW